MSLRTPTSRRDAADSARSADHARGAAASSVDLPTQPIELPTTGPQSPTATLALPGRVVWAEVDAGFWTAQRDGAFFGSIDRVVGGYVARDAVGTPVGRYESLKAARASLRTVTTSRTIGRRRRREWIAASVAAATGGFSIAFAASASAFAASF